SGIGFEWSPKLVSHQRLLLFREVLICLSYSGMNMVVPAGNAPASSGYQPDALLLSYETVVNCASRRAGSPGGTPGSTAVEAGFAAHDSVYSSDERAICFENGW